MFTVGHVGTGPRRGAAYGKTEGDAGGAGPGRIRVCVEGVPGVSEAGVDVRVYVGSGRCV